MASNSQLPPFQGQKRQRLDSIKNPQPRPPPGYRPQPPSKRRKTASRPRCPNPVCESQNLVDEDGQVICSDCGEVVEDANIVADPAFMDGAGGATIKLGSNVGNDQARARNAASYRIGGLGRMDSREVAEARGQADLQETYVSRS